jgi:nucleoid DNA-binding protein
MIQKKVRKIIREIANELNIPYDVAEKAVQSQFGFVKEAMAEGIADDEDSFKNIQLLHFGKFVVKPGRLNYINKNKDGKNASAKQDGSKDGGSENS